MDTNYSEEYKKIVGYNQMPPYLSPEQQGAAIQKFSLFQPEEYEYRNQVEFDYSKNK